MTMLSCVKSRLHMLAIPVALCVVTMLYVLTSTGSVIQEPIANTIRGIVLQPKKSVEVDGDENKHKCESTSLDPKTKDHISEIARLLHKAKTHVRGTKTADNLMEATKLMDTVLSSLDIDKQHLFSRKVSQSKHICPEEYKGSQFGYPMFYHGFELTNCPYSKPLSELLSVVVYIKGNGTNDTEERTSGLLESIMNTSISNITVIIATNPLLEKPISSSDNVIFLTVKTPKSDGEVWNELVGAVKTPYVLITRDMEIFTEDARLERLVREIDALHLSVAAGAVRYPDGHWKKGCYQSVHRNFTLRYLEGYDESMHECVFCDYALGPFVASIETLKTIPFAKLAMDDGMFNDWFLRLTKTGNESIVCPDSMFHIGYAKEKTNWQTFMSNLGLYKYISPEGQTFISDCSIDNEKSEKSLALSPCKLRDNADAVKFVMEMCENHQLFCELQEGTSMGAVKFGKVLPWEVDADIGFLINNNSEVQEFGKILKKNHGYRIIQSAKNVLILGKGLWSVEMYAQERLDTVILLDSGLVPTRILFDGQWLRAPRNPGMFSRNRYGPEIFQHAIHWRASGHKSGWEPYKPNSFPPCSIPGSHQCLDRYNADGNLQFLDPLP